MVPYMFNVARGTCDMANRQEVQVIIDLYYRGSKKKHGRVGRTLNSNIVGASWKVVAKVVGSI